MDVYKWYQAERRLFLHHIPVLPQLIKAGIRILWGGGNTLPSGDWRRYYPWLSGLGNRDSQEE